MSSVAGLADWELGVLTGVFGVARMISDIPAGLFIQRYLGLLRHPGARPHP